MSYSELMPYFSVSSERKENAVYDALRAISRVLGKEYEYDQFADYINRTKNTEAPPDSKEIASRMPVWVQLVSAPLTKLYETAYMHGYRDASQNYDIASTR